MSSSPQFQKWQRNELFKTIEIAGLDPIEFEFENSDAGIRLKHKWSDSCFIFSGDSGHYVGRCVVGDGPDWPYEIYSWQSLVPRVRRWLEEVKRDLETPDLWADLQREAELLGGASNEATENTPFTPDEQKEVAGQLQELAEYVGRTYSLSGQQMQILNAKLDYLVDASRRLGRKDWINAFAGAVLGFILAAALPPESARYIFLTLLRAIGHLYGSPELPGL
jgi:hypothetical protein